MMNFLTIDKPILSPHTYTTTLQARLNMPYIAVNVSETISDAKKEAVKAAFGSLITIIPEKSEAVTMVDFSDSRTIYMAGKKVEGAFIDVRLWKKADFEAKKQFSEKTFDMLEKELGLKKENMYLNITEFNEWGSRGTYKA